MRKVQSVKQLLKANKLQTLDTKDQLSIKGGAQTNIIIADTFGG